MQHPQTRTSQSGMEHYGGMTSQEPPQQTMSERPQMKPITIDEIVETDVVTAERSTPIATVVAEMSEKDVGSVVVVEDETPVGILTDRTIALELETNPDVTDQKAEDVISEDLVTGTTDMSIFDALQRLEDENVRRLPIVDEDGSLEGIVTLDDILVLLGTELEHATSIIKAQSPRL